MGALLQAAMPMQRRPRLNMDLRMAALRRAGRSLLLGADLGGRGGLLGDDGLVLAGVAVAAAPDLALARLAITWTHGKLLNDGGPPDDGTAAIIRRGL